MIDAQDLIENYREWLGVKFLHQGRTRLGADCLGFIAGGAAEKGSDVFLRRLPLNYARSPQRLLLDRLEKLSRQIELQPAALLTIRWPGDQHASHGAIFTGSTIIHCYEANRKVIEHSYGGAWVARTTSIWAIPLVRYL